MKTVKSLLLTLWQLPQNLLGAIIWFVCQVNKRTTQHWNGRLIVEWGLNSGLSLGYFIFVRSANAEKTVKHEYGHTKQSLLLGWLYLIIIGLPSIIWAGCFGNYRAKHRVSYYAFYTESWADKLGGVVRG